MSDDKNTQDDDPAAGASENGKANASEKKQALARVPVAKVPASEAK